MVDIKELARRIVMIDPYGEYTPSQEEVEKEIEQNPENIIEMLLYIIEQ